MRAKNSVTQKFEVSWSFLGALARNLKGLEGNDVLFKFFSHSVRKKWQNSTQQQKERRYFQVGRAYYGRDIIGFSACWKIVISNVFWSKNGMGVERASRAFRPWKCGVKIFTNDGDPLKRKFGLLWGRNEGQKLRNTELLILAKNLSILAGFLRGSESHTSRCHYLIRIRFHQNRRPKLKDSWPESIILCLS